MKTCLLIDGEWLKMECVLRRFKNADCFMKQMSIIEFGLSFRLFDPLIVGRICFPSVVDRIGLDKSVAFCVEPKISSTFVENFIQVSVGSCGLF